MRKQFLILLGLAYLITWIGAGLAHSREMAQIARDRYVSAQAYNARNLESDRLNGYFKTSPSIELRPHGPKSSVNWCVPILPGVLLADSHYAVGPLYGKGSTKLILYYGAGTVTLMQMWGWIS